MAVRRPRVVPDPLLDGRATSLPDSGEFPEGSVSFAEVMLAHTTVSDILFTPTDATLSTPHRRFPPVHR